MNRLGEYLRAAIELRNTDQVWLAQETGSSTKHINQLCQGNAGMSASLALRIEQALFPHATAEKLLTHQVRDQLDIARARALKGGTE